MRGRIWMFVSHHRAFFICADIGFSAKYVAAPGRVLLRYFQVAKLVLQPDFSHPEAHLLDVVLKRPGLES